MARNRMIKPEFWESETLASVSRDARLMFIGLWNFSDDYGVCQASPRRIIGDIFPLDEDVTIPKLNKWIDELLKNNLICKVSYNNKSLFSIRSFREHQVINRPSKRRYIEDANYQEVIKDSWSNHGVLIDDSLNTHVALNDERERERERERELSDEFVSFWQVYPKKDNKDKSRSCYIKYRKAGITVEQIGTAMNCAS